MIHVAALAGLLLLGSARAAERPDEFAYRAPITFVPGQAIYEVELPLAVHRGTRRADLGDLRVFNGAGEVVPHALRTVTAQPAEQTPLEAKIFPYRVSLAAREIEGRPDMKIELRPDGAMVIGVQGRPLRAAADPQPSAYFLDLGVTDKAFKALKLDWEPVAGGFSGRVDLHASEDLRAWRTVTTGAPLLDLQRGEQRLELSRIEFPALRTRYLRMTWPATPSLPAIRLAWVEPVAQAERVRRTTEYEAQRGEKEGEYLVDLGAPLAVQKLQINLPQQNTVGSIEISARSRASDRWQRVERATFYRLLHEGKEWHNAEHAVRMTPARYWQLKVDSRGGGLGAGLPKLLVTWEPRLLVFVARGEGPFTLAYGHAKYEPAAFRVETLIPGLAEGKPVSVATATLGTPDTSAPAKHSGRMGELFESLSGDEGRRWLLWSILVAGVTILGVMAWRMAKNLGNTERRE